MLPLDRFSALVGRIYGAGSGAEPWPAVLKELCDFIGASTGAVAYTEDADRLPVVHASLGSEEAVADYVAHYQRIDPVFAQVLRRPAGVPYTDEMVMPRSELIRSEIHDYFCRRHETDGVVQAFAHREATCSGFFAAGRSTRRDAFGREQADLLALLLPYLGHAMRVDLKLRAANIERGATADVLDRLTQGVVLADGSARVLHANRVAEAMFIEADGLGIDASGLRAATPAHTAQLRRLVARAAGVGEGWTEGGSLPLERPSGRRPLAAVVVPLVPPMAWSPSPHARAAVFVTDPERADAAPPRRLRELYGLTAAEARTALALLDAEGLRDVADGLGVGLNTVRTHLQRVFNKTGARRQAELVRLLTRLGSPEG